MRRKFLKCGLWSGLVCGIAAQQAAAQPTVRVSVSEAGAQAAGGTYSPTPVISGDGTTVAFVSPLSSLVPGDTNQALDVFIVSGGAVSRVVGATGVQLDCSTERPALSETGQFVVFDSCASNVVAGDTNGANDVFVLDRAAGTVTRVSLATGGGQANGPSFSAAISPNGRYVAFLSGASNVAGGFAGVQVYRYDRNTGTTVLISRANGGGASGNSSASGRPAVDNQGLVAFTSTASNLVADTNSVADVFVGDGTTTARVSVSNTGAELASASGSPGISADGRLVSFTTAAQAAANDGNPVNDVYVRDRTAGVTVLVSQTAAGQAGNGSSFEPFISPSGGFISFTSLATDIAAPFDALLDVFRASLDVGGGAVAVSSVTKISVGSRAMTGTSTESAVANTGAVAFASNEPSLVADDFNGDTDVFVASAPGSIQRVSLTAAGLDETYSGRSYRAATSFTGNVVAFLSTATNLVPGDINGRADVFVRDIAAGTTTRLPVPAGYDNVDASWVSISHDGRWVAYSRLVTFLHDRATGTTVPVSVATAGAPPAQASQPTISASGRHVAFVTSVALTTGDNNGQPDIYVHDRIAGTTTLASRPSAGGFGNGASLAPAISGDGRFVAFASLATNMAPGDTNPASDIFVRDMVAGTTRWLSGVPPEPDTDSRDPDISDDGQYVSFLFLSSVLSQEGSSPSRVYVSRTDGAGGPRGSLSSIAGEVSADDSAYDPTLSLFGRYLAFRSYKPDLVAGDTNNAADVFARQVLDPTGAPVIGPAVLVTRSTAGTSATGGGATSTENPQISPNGPVVAYQSGFTNLVAGDTNGMEDVFARQNVFAQAECQQFEAALPGYTAWAAGLGLDPCSDAGSPFADPDSDGFTNNEERTGVGGDGDPILGVFTRYFAEGATKTAGLDFDVRIALANPNAFPVRGELSYQLPSGIPIAPTPFMLAPYERTTILLDEQPGIAETGPEIAYEFATTVRATAPIGVDRTMTWDKNVYAGHAEVGVVSQARTWYFAEGATISGFNLFYLLQNPTAETATVRGRYLLGTGQTFQKSYVLPPNSRTNVWANVEQIDGGTPLASAEFSAVFEVTSGPAIIAERAMYRGSAPFFKAGHESAGITEPAVEWFLAEGNAGDFFDLFVLIGNTTGSDALIEAEYTVGSPSTVYTKQYNVLRNSRFNIWVDLEELSPGVRPFSSGNTDVSVRIRSLNGVPLIVERAMWWPGGPPTWYEAHNSPATARTSARWVLGEGEAGGPLNWQTFVLVANTGAAAGQIQMRLLLPGGVTQTVTYSVPGKSRQTFALADVLAAAGLPRETRAGVLVESVGAPLPLVVERAMYRNANGQTFVVGTNALGTPLP